jgi:aspartyl-tRNA(Asn)/glutamyl-tRNA(Gln) amidotransferase subunit A
VSGTDLAYLSAHEAGRLLRSREISPVELVRACLARIEALNSRLNAFVTVTADQALEAARQAEAELLKGEQRGPLQGIPLAVKDIFATRGVRTTSGSRIFADWIPEYDAAAVERLRAAGALIVGKTNTHEFAFGATTINPHYGPTRNPWDERRVAGGSSGGSAVALAAGMASLALGSDTGGSIRLPAAVTGTIGLKPTYGLVSRHGVMPLSWSQDHVGPMARTVQDAALALTVLAGHDERDPASARRPFSDFSADLDLGVGGLRLGLLKEQFELPTDPDVLLQVREATAALERHGAHIEEVSYAEHAHAMAAGSLILFSEAASVHARWIRERPADYGGDVRVRLQQGSLVPAAWYLRAQRARRLLVHRFNHLFSRVDAVLSPAVPVPPFRQDEPVVNIGGISLDARGALLRNTRLYNLLGLPAISVPCGLTRAGLPAGLQVAAPAFKEAIALRVARAVELAFPPRYPIA